MSGALEAVRTYLAQALEECGILTAQAWERTALPALSGAAAVIGVQETHSGAAAFWNYLGEETDEESGAVSERYGRMLEVTLFVDFYAPKGHAADIEEGFAALEETLLSPLCQGLRAETVQRGEIGADGKSGYLKGRCTAVCRAYFTAARTEESATLTDFQLKGVVQ